MIYLLTAIGLTSGGSSKYKFTNKQCTEQHNETEYTEHNIKGAAEKPDGF